MTVQANAKRPPMVRVLWRDVSAAQKVWQHRKKIKPDERQVTSVGWLVYEDDQSIMLAQDWDSGEGNFSGVATYPRGMVDEVTLLG